jgi:hypothetical protein
LDEPKQKWPAVLSEGILNKIRQTEGIMSLVASLNVDIIFPKTTFRHLYANPHSFGRSMRDDMDKEATGRKYKKFPVF